MATETDDGVNFDVKGLRIETIREEVEYGGSRLRTTTALASACIPITVDIGFGDAVEPEIEDIDLPVLLDMPSPHLRAYPPETVMGEKFHAMVVLGRANSRMNDYYDVWMLMKHVRARARAIAPGDRGDATRSSRPRCRTVSATHSPMTRASSGSGRPSPETFPVRFLNFVALCANCGRS